MLHLRSLLVLMLTACALFAGRTDAANVLAMFPLPSKSHWFALKPLFVELSNRGHNITLVTPPIEDVPDTWEILLVENKMRSFAGIVNMMKAMSEATGWSLYSTLIDGGLDACESYFEQPSIQKLIRTKEKRFDLLVMELFQYNCFYAFAHKFGIPVVGVSSFGGFVWATDAVGDPHELSYVPDVALDLTDHMTFCQRLRNAFTVMYARYVHNYRFIPKADELIQKYFKDPTMPSLSELEANTSLLLLQTHVSFGFPRPHLPNVIETGGMHIKPPGKLPEDLQKFLDNSTDGVIYFSMGSLVRSSEFSEEQLQAFLTVFSKIKQVILWKWEKEDIPGKSANVKLANWLPQADLLAHKNIRLFISHGGLQSTLEATSRGVPVVGIPVGGDQRYNVVRAEAAGYCIRLELTNITAQSLEWAITEILNNPRYHENAQLRSRLFHDRPEPAVDTAVYWTEYILRHKGARHLRSAALDLSWYQFLLLDVLVVLLLGAATLLSVLGYVIRTIYNLLRANVSVMKTRIMTKRTKKQ